jgi:hypothetical protein
MEKKLEAEDIGTLLHGILFAYQKSVKDILGTGASIFVRPILDIVKTINERAGVNLIKGDNIDEVFDNLSKVMQTTGIMQGFRFEKLASAKYVLHIEKCVWAPHVHADLEPEDVTCPFALISMAIFEKVLKNKVKVNDSEYSKDGTATIIELLK